MNSIKQLKCIVPARHRNGSSFQSGKLPATFAHKTSTIITLAPQLGLLSVELKDCMQIINCHSEPFMATRALPNEGQLDVKR